MNASKERPNGSAATLSEQDVQDLLVETSRTFAVCIPMLPERIRQPVGVAYLLYRVADTIEDGTSLNKAQRIQLLQDFGNVLESAQAGKPEWIPQGVQLQGHCPTGNEDDLRLFQQVTRVVATAVQSGPVVSRIMLSRVRTSVEGMGKFVAQGDHRGSVQLHCEAELWDYCYCVAGLVGEMLTELFLYHQPHLQCVSDALLSRASDFGEALQLVNILKDADTDQSEGRRFIPPKASRTMLIDRARLKLTSAQQYIDVLRENAADQGIVQFTQFPVSLATRTLDRLAVEGPGAKISRAEVLQIIKEVGTMETMKLANHRDATSESNALGNSESSSGRGLGVMKVLLANPRGFCAGVQMAVDALDLTLKTVRPPVYVYHEIVHNQHIVADFRDRGAVFVDSISEVPRGEVLMYSAHGVSPEIREEAKQRGLRTIDATCPLVTKVHLEAIRLSQSGHTLILIGHAGHDEVVGTLGEAPDAFHLVESVEDVKRLEIADDVPLAWMSQTTLSVSETQEIVDELNQRFPRIVGPRKSDICYATQNRQFAVRELCQRADAVVVVGSHNSSNSQRLRETATNAGVFACLVDDASKLSLDDFKDYETIAVTAGASAPEAAVQDVTNWFVENFGAVVESETFMDEHQVFPLPKELVSMQENSESLSATKNPS